MLFNVFDIREETPMPARYEYRVVPFQMKWQALRSNLQTDFPAIEKEMNEMGADGWELVKMVEVLGSGGLNTVATVALVATFKRPVE
jgi:hypothetical protein